MATTLETQPPCIIGIAKMMRVLAVVLFLGGAVSGAQAKVQADPATGRIVVETKRYTARFDGGTLVYLHNRLKNRTMIDVALTPNLPIGPRTALYVADQPKTEPYWIFPATEGDGRAAVTVGEQGRDGVAVTFTGLVAKRGQEIRTFPKAELTVTVKTAGTRGDLQVAVTGRSPDTLVVGSALAYAGLMIRSYDYTTFHSGLRRFIDLGSPHLNAGSLTYSEAQVGARNGVIEWANCYMEGERLGLKGGLWPAAVTVQAAAEDPSASFAVWAEDDVPRSKYLIEQGNGNAYATYEMPPYDHNHQAESVVWRVNVFDGGWAAAATPFADSLKRRGYVDGRASWRNDISLVLFAPGVQENWLEAYKATFPPEVRHRILIWLPQSWRDLENTRDAKTKDAYYWDNTFSAATAADIRAAVAAGFRVSGYTNPHLVWGNWKQVIDPEIGELVREFQQKRWICPILQEPLQGATIPSSLAYTPYREHMLRTYQHIFDHLDMSVYMDTTHQMMLDGRGRSLCGMSSYEGALAFFRAARALKRDQLIGMEELTELGVMGGCGDYSLFYDLGWAAGWEKAKAANTHPILGYLFRDTSIQVPHLVDPWVFTGTRWYHLYEEISERIGTIASTQWVYHQKTSPADKLDTPEKQHWFAKIQLYTRRGLRPQFPETWEDGVMSYLKAADGATFKFIETDYGSKLVEFPRRGKPVLHYARAWKGSRVPAEAGHVPDWIGVADNGDSIGLDSAARAGYVLFPQPDRSAAHLRLNALPANLAIIQAKVEPDLAVVELGPGDRKLEKTGVRDAIEGIAGKPVTPITGTVGLVTDRPLVRIASMHQPAPVLKPLGQRDGQYRYELTGEFWGELAFVWREGVFAPFEPTDDYLLPVTAAPPIEPGEFFTVLQPMDQRWNAEIGGPRNPRPGTVYQVTVMAETIGDQPGTMALFLGDLGKSMGLFQATFQMKWDGRGPQSVTFAGVRKPGMQPGTVRALALRSYPVGNANVRIKEMPPVRFIRPILKVSDTKPIDLGQVAKGATAASATREIVNGQVSIAAANGKAFPTVLYGAAHITAPNEKRPDLQENDHTGVVLTGKDAKLFRLKGEHAGPDGGILLVGADGQSGLTGGAQPEKETFTVEFLGTPELGEYAATVRIVTQAGNLGVCSTGQDGEPLAGLHYVDIAVGVRVQ